MTRITNRLSPAGFGLLAAGLMAGLYFAIVSIAESPAHALDLFWQDRWIVFPILAGFGVQAGLYALLRQRVAATHGAGGLMGAGGGSSTVAMVACCAHRVADVLPFIGLSAAAGFLAAWKVPFMIVGLTFSLAGVAVIVTKIIRYKRQHMPREE